MTLIVVPTWLLWLLCVVIAANAVASIYKSWLLLKLKKDTP